jgi:acyl-CoA hydrolase
MFVGTATPPDRFGYMSLSLSATYEVDMLENADIVILEVNEKYPRTFGDVIIHIDQVHHIIEADYEPPQLPIAPVSEEDKKIAESIFEHLENGITLQLGIGGMPNAVGKLLLSLKDVGIHTEMLTEGMMELFEAGVITGRKKTLYPNKMVCTFALGSRKLYDFINENPGVIINRGKWVNNPYVIAQNYKQISINSALEVDLTGQVCSESIGPDQFSGTGGQADTAIGAQMSPGGKSFICLYSTATVKGKDGNKKVISKITPMLKEGAKVTLHRANVDYIVTEYGCVRLKGLSVRERAKKLISIAHPDFRDWLTEEAKRLRYI